MSAINRFINNAYQWEAVKGEVKRLKDCFTAFKAIPKGKQSQKKISILAKTGQEKGGTYLSVHSLWKVYFLDNSRVS